MEIFAVVPPGLGAVALGEAKALGLPKAREVEGGIEFSGGWPEIYRANLFLRTPSRVLARVGTFPAVSFPELERKLKKLDWRGLLPQSGWVEPSVSCSKSKLNHTGRIGAVLLDALGREGVGEGGGIGVHLRFVRDVVTVSIDTSGELLHRRGYRSLTGYAPIRENLAAACLLALGYRGDEALLDPCCGSGTFPVEAALIAANIAPGMQRSFAFERLPEFDPGVWSELKAQAASKVVKPQREILGSDIDLGAVKLTVASAKAAGVGDYVGVAVADMEELEEPAESGLLVANPPYGLRLGGNAYKKLARLLTGPFFNWRWGVIECRKSGSHELRLDGHEALDFSSGGLRLRLLAGKCG